MRENQKTLFLIRDFTLAISTHPGEERIITEAWRGVSSANLLVLIPRHPSPGTEHH
jgi:3-deoxy-D-manno-octulosonic-acid transferase